MKTHRKKLCLPIMALYLLAACATTPEGKVYQVGKVLAALGNAVGAACEQGTLDQATCVKASVAYDQAEASWIAAARLVKEDQPVSAQMIDILSFVLTTAETLRFAGVKVPAVVDDYLSVVKGGLQ